MVAERVARLRGWFETDAVISMALLTWERERDHVIMHRAACGSLLNVSERLHSYVEVEPLELLVFNYSS